MASRFIWMDSTLQELSNGTKTPNWSLKEEVMQVVELLQLLHLGEHHLRNNKAIRHSEGLCSQQQGRKIARANATGLPQRIMTNWNRIRLT